MRMQSQYKSSEAFELYSKLPVELRRKIWHETIDWKQHVIPLPRLYGLEVCRESRQVLLEIHKPCFQPHPFERRLGRCFFLGGRQPFSLYANFETDVLLLSFRALRHVNGTHDWAELLAPEALGNIKHVALTIMGWSLRPLDAIRKDERKRLIDFSGLKSLSFIIDARYEVTNQRGIWPDPPTYIPGTDDDMTLVEVRPGEQNYAEERILVKAYGDYRKRPILNHGIWDIDTGREFISDMEKKFPPWKVPNVQLARVVYGNGL